MRTLYCHSLSGSLLRGCWPDSWQLGWLLSADSWGDVDSGAGWVTLHWAHCLSRHGHQPRCHSQGGIISSLLLLMKRNFETFVCNCILQLVWIKIQIRDSYKLITNFSCFIFVTQWHSVANNQTGTLCTNIQSESDWSPGFYIFLDYWNFLQKSSYLKSQFMSIQIKSVNFLTKFFNPSSQSVRFSAWNFKPDWEIWRLRRDKKRNMSSLGCHPPACQTENRLRTTIFFILLDLCFKQSQPPALASPSLLNDVN